MKTKSRLLAGVLCFALVALCVFALSACGGCSHEFGAWETKTAATCTQAGEKTRTCADCGETESEAIPALGHSFTVEAVKAEALKSAATATSAAVYYKSCACGAIATSDADTFTSGDPLGHVHSYTVETVSENTLKAEANCENGAVYYKSCACGDIATGDADTFVVGDALGHKDENLDHECDRGCGKNDMGAHTDAANDNDHLCDYGCLGVVEACSDKAGDGDHKCDVCGNVDISTHTFGNATCGAPATCTECGATTGTTLAHKDDNFDHICDNGCGKNDMGAHADSLTDNDHVCDYGCLATFSDCTDVPTDGDHKCDVCGKENVTAHAYVETASTPATCEDAATKTYTCNCGDSYTDPVGDALGHDITGVDHIEERNIANCGVEFIYECKRPDCGEKIVGKTVYNHTYVASISKPATCSENGEKTFTCSVCGDTSQPSELIPADATGHNWESVSTEGNVRTDECSHCHEERTVTVYTGTTADNLTKDDLKEEIEVNNANISLGDGVLDKIGDQNVSVSANTLDETAREELLTEKQLAQVGDNPIYNFTIEGADGNISDFGEGNLVTITLPYTLSEGEDVDSIAVWFINDNGELESIPATYNNGFVTFHTDHFSYYTVTRLTPAERCALYGHGYVLQHVAGSCTKDSYDLYVCVRCHDQKTENYVVADGHNYVADTHEASCTENGYTLYTCSDCGHAYRIRIVASGHDWQVVDTGEVSCVQDGFTKYACSKCDGEYSVVTPKLAHVYTNTVVPATCSADGYTLHECDNCDYSYTDGHTEALGHDYEAGEWSWESNGNKAFLNFVCTHDAEHVTSIHAEMDKVVTKGECSNYVIRTHTATVVFEGETYTDVMIIRQGNPNHTFSDAWTRDEAAHWHECICGEKTDVAPHTFENPTVTKEATCKDNGELSSSCVCGKVHVETIPATGEHTYVDGFCTACGTEFIDTYYLNLVSSWKDMDGFAIKVENLSFTMSQKDTSLLDSFRVITSLKQIDVAELCLYVEDGVLGGAATGALEFYDNYLTDEGKYKFDAVIEDGYVYLRMFEGESLNKVTYRKISVEALLSSLLDEVDMPEESMTVLATLANDVVVPALGAFIEANAEGIDSVLESIFNIFFTFEKKDGSVVATLDYDKLAALNENLATKTVAELVDIYFGEGAFDAIFTWANDLLDLPVSELPAFIDGIGINSAELFEKLNAIARASGAGEDYDIAEMLAGEEYKDVTVAMLLNSEDDLTEMLDELAEFARATSVYAMIDPEEVNTIKETVAECLAPFADALTVSFTTDASGMLSSVKLATEGLTLDYGRKIDVAFDLEILVNEKIDVTWSEIVEEIDEKVVLPEANTLQPSAWYTMWTSNESKTFQFGETEYTSNQYREVYGYVPLLDNLSDITFGADCTGWMWYDAQFAARKHNFYVYSLGSSRQEIFVDAYTEKAALLTLTENGVVTVLFEDGTERAFNFVPLESATSLELQYLSQYLSAFDNPEGKISHFYSSSLYYYNAESGAFSYESAHKLSEEHTLLGETCEDGRRVTTTCANCDYSETRTVTWCENSYVDIDLSAQGACAGTIASVYCCEHCGKVWESNIRFGCAFNDDATYEDILDGDGNVVGEAHAYTCSSCGLVHVVKRWTEPTGTCTYKSHYDTYAYLNGELVFSNEEYSSGANHDYEYTYELEGETCEDGYTVTMTCTVCNEVYTGYDWGHRTAGREISLSELGLCEGMIWERYCTICNEVVGSSSSTSCAWENGGVDADGHKIGVCATCGATRIDASYDTPKDEACILTHYDVYIYVVDGEEVYRSETSYLRRVHAMQMETVLLGETCEDGVKYIDSCTDCDYREEYMYYGHFPMAVDLGDHAVCDGHHLIISVCPCGKEASIEVDFDSFDEYYYDEATGADVYSCETCGVTLSSWAAEVEEGCLLVNMTGVTVTQNGEELFRHEGEYEHANHSFTDMTVSVVDGVTVITYTCEKCGTVSTTETMSCEMEEHEDGWYYDYVFTPNASGSYTVEGISIPDFYIDTYVTLYQMVNGSLVQIAYNDEGGNGGQFRLSQYLEAGETYVYRIGFYNYDEEGTISFAFTQGVSEAASCYHSREYFSILPNGATSCEEGVLAGYACEQCGSISDLFTFYEHVTHRNSIDLQQFGACYGTMYEDRCACGEISDAYFSYNCAYLETEIDTTDEEGRPTFGYVRTCPDCGLRITDSYYKEKVGCTVTEHHTLVVDISDVLVCEKEYTVSREEHAYESSGVLVEGATSCEEGAVITHTCKDCGASDSYTTYYHENFVKERIDLSQYGSSCGGYAAVRGCACGVSNSLNFDACHCDLYLEPHESWVENALDGWQETISGENSFYQHAYLRICAVTDPTPCTFKIRYANYWKKVEGECYAIHYETWQLGYNEETGEYLDEVTFQTSEPRVYHDYVETQTENGYSLYCADCGSYYRYTSTYDDETGSSYEEIEIKNNLDDGNNKLRHEIREYTYGENFRYERFYARGIYADGTEYWVEETDKQSPYTGTFGENGFLVESTNADSSGYSDHREEACVYYKGHLYSVYTYVNTGDDWYSYDYSYSFDGECLHTEVYTDSTGETRTKTYSYCYFWDAETVKEPTCTQDGEYYEICDVCGKHSEPYTSYATGHDWVELADGWHFCYRCHLENQNGASGAIDLEDLTDAYGNGENYVVGYNKSTYVEFTQYVSLILANGDEIICTGIDIFALDGVRAYAFSKAAVDAWAAENGYTDYDVRFAFVPEGMDGSLDYAITFAEPLFSDTVEGNVVGRVSFTEYVAEGETKRYTIAPTEDALWLFTSFASEDTYVTLYDANENLLDYNDDGSYGYNFKLLYELKAGEIYYVDVRWLSSGYAGEMPLLFAPDPRIPQ